MLLACFATTRERVVPKQAAAGSFWTDVKDIARNDQWRIVGVLTILNILAVATRGGAMMYYVTYIMGQAGLFTWFLFDLLGGQHRGVPADQAAHRSFLQSACLYLDQRRAGASSVAMFFVPLRQSLLMFALIFVIGVLHQMITPIQWVMMSDTVDYGEWKHGRRLTGSQFRRHAVCAEDSVLR